MSLAVADLADWTDRTALGQGNITSLYKLNLELKLEIFGLRNKFWILFGNIGNSIKR